MRPNFDDLSYFLEVANTKKLSRAAERLGITQPSISAAMKRLELSFDTELLVRSRNGVQLTKAGRELHCQGRKFLADWTHLKSSVLRASTEMEGSFVMGCHPSVALYTLPTLVPKLKALFPLVSINFAHDLSRKITEQIVSYEIDFGLVINPFHHPDLVIHRLFLDEVTVWTSPEPTPFQDINSERCALYCDPNLKQTQELLKNLSQHQFKLEYSNNLEVIASLVAEGMGLGLLPARVAKRNLKPLLPLGESIARVTDELCFVHRADAQNNSVSLKLRREIKSILAEQ